LDDNLQKLEAALNNREISADENPVEDSAPQEENQVDDSTEAEKPAEEEVKEPKPDTESDEMQLVEDEEGKKYIPEKRFKEVYAKLKENERRAKELERELSSKVAPALERSVPTDKADALEVELLFAKYPQFDPSHPDYDADVDDLAADLYIAGKAKTKLEAAKIALEKVKVLSSKSSTIKDEARVIKKMMAESVTTKGGGRAEVQPDIDKMSTEELESYMKARGEWL